ncbi:hypothetical protein KEM48_007542 [Puccinia striiformis f. sp. tritici PST-130]|nr:hypothetical protein KEM48_007542 [Puccinia striiformis f. sp. tritici PST-130]
MKHISTSNAVGIAGIGSGPSEVDFQLKEVALDVAQGDWQRHSLNATAQSGCPLKQILNMDHSDSVSNKPSHVRLTEIHVLDPKHNWITIDILSSQVNKCVIAEYLVRPEALLLQLRTQAMGTFVVSSLILPPHVQGLLTAGLSKCPFSDRYVGLLIKCRKPYIFKLLLPQQALKSNPDQRIFRGLKNYGTD